MSGRGDPVRLHRARATRLQAPQSIAGLPTTRARGLPKRVPKLRSSESTEENSEHLAELKTPGNNSYDVTVQSSGPAAGIPAWCSESCGHGSCRGGGDLRLRS